MRWLWLAFKPVPVLGLTLWVLEAPESAYRNRLAAGLALSLIGDVLIEWSFAAGLAAFLWSGLGDLRPAVVAYVVAICTMVWRAAARVGRSGAPRAGEWAGLAGAIFFALSDTLIALDRFHGPVPYARVPIILLYWTGQAGIAWSARSR